MKEVFMMVVELASRFGIVAWALHKSDNLAQQGNEIGSLKFVVMSLLLVVMYDPLMRVIRRRGREMDKK